jgi:hypothetical protein
LVLACASSRQFDRLVLRQTLEANRQNDVLGGCQL